MFTRVYLSDFFLKSCPIQSPMLTKNFVQNVFGVQKLSKYLSLLVAFINCSLHARNYLTVIDAQKEMRIARPFSELCSIKPWGRKMLEIAVTYGLSKISPRKYWMTDRNPNPTRTFRRPNIFFTPIYNSSHNSMFDIRTSCPRYFKFSTDFSWLNLTFSFCCKLRQCQICVFK